jgi:hypothetical protein
MWVDSRGGTSAKTATVNDRLHVHIPKSVDDAGKTYLTPKAFLNADDCSNFWTVAPATKIVRGVYELEITNASMLESALEAVFTVTDVVDNDFGSDYMRHWVVSAS